MDNLTPVDYKPMTLRETIDALFNGDVLLVKGLEQSRKKDVLVRLNIEGKIPVTQISYDVMPPDGEWRKSYWAVYDLPFNVFSTYPCYIYDATTTNNPPKYLVGATVYYTSKQDGVFDSAIVTEVLKDENNKWYYQLSRDNQIYAEDEVSTDRLK